MTEAVDLLVSPQLARQEIRALCRSMTEEVDARAAAACVGAAAIHPGAAGDARKAHEGEEMSLVVDDDRV